MTLYLSNVQYLNEEVQCVCYYQIMELYLQSHAFHLMQILSQYLHFRFSMLPQGILFLIKNNFGFDILYLFKYLFNLNTCSIPSSSVLSFIISSEKVFSTNFKLEYESKSQLVFNKKQLFRIF